MEPEEQPLQGEEPPPQSEEPPPQARDLLLRLRRAVEDAWTTGEIKANNKTQPTVSGQTHVSAGVRRGAPVAMLDFGFTSGKGFGAPGKPMVNNAKYPEIYHLLQQLALVLTRPGQPQFECFTINIDNECKAHFHKNNIGETVIVGWGDYTGWVLLLLFDVFFLFGYLFVFILVSEATFAWSTSTGPGTRRPRRCTAPPSARTTALTSTAACFGKQF